MKLISKKAINIDDIQTETLDPSFRKATINMIASTISCEETLGVLPKDFPKNQISFLFLSHFGELDSTLDFLSTYYETQVSRPILFQNSLHNSTLGFTSIQLGLTGPAITLALTAENIDSTALLIDSMLSETEAVLVCLTDYIPKLLASQYLTQFPFLQKTINRAQSFLFLRESSNLQISAIPLNCDKFSDVLF